MKKIRVLLIGHNGQMGRAISGVVESEPGFAITAQCELGDELSDKMQDIDVAVDFSHADATELICATAAEKKAPLVIGTTGHSSEQRAKIKEAAKTIPVIYSPNFSVGVNTLFWLTRKTAELLGDDFDLEIVEMHHRLKKDAPSGTAKQLTEILMEARKSPSRTGSSVGEIDNVRHGRDGNVGERSDTEIGVHAVRGGDVVGDHTVIFSGIGERLELTHRASARETFARGALRAARWIIGKPAGLYSMQDVLGL
jgi:4-hydroxy-tetrahydrodipicolinate reductase